MSTVNSNMLRAMTRYLLMSTNFNGGDINDLTQSVRRGLFMHCDQFVFMDYVDSTTNSPKMILFELNVEGNQFIRHTIILPQSKMIMSIANSIPQQRSTLSKAHCEYLMWCIIFGQYRVESCSRTKIKFIFKDMGGCSFALFAEKKSETVYAIKAVDVSRIISNPRIYSSG